MGSKNMVGVNLVSAALGARGVCRSLVASWILAAGLGCSASRQEQPKKQTTPAESSPPPPADQSPSQEVEARATSPQAFACAGRACTTFETASDALATVLSDQVRIVGFGEAHAPSDFTARTTVRRFQEDLLPGFAPPTGRLLVELLAAPKDCETARK